MNRHLKIVNLHAIGFALACLWANGSMAQASGSLPRNPQEAAREPQPASRDQVLKLPTDRPFDQAPAGAGGQTLVLSDVQLQGNTTISSYALQRLWAPLVGKSVSVQQVFELAGKITAAYREAGYVLSQVIVPAQDLRPEGATVQLRMVEGYVGKVSVNPAGLRGAAGIQRAVEPITLERPVTLATLETRLLSLNDLPGVSVQANLTPGGAPGSADIELVAQRLPAAVSASIHNRTSKATGPVRLELGADIYGLLADFDHHGLRVSSSGNNRLLLLSYNGDAALGSGPWIASWSVTGSKSKPATGAVFNLDTDSATASAGLTYTVLRSRQTNFSLRANIGGYNGKTELVQTGVFESQRLRTVRLGFAADRTDSYGGINLLDVEWARGLSGLGASTTEELSGTRFGIKPDFSKLTAYAARLQDLGGPWTALLAVQGQHTRDLLPNAEQYGLGGDSFLRGYSPSEILGDTGYAAKLELRRNVAWSNGSATLYAFAETGRVTLRGSLGDPDLVTRVDSYGLGVRASLPGGLRTYLEAAKPSGKNTDQGNQRARLFGGAAIAW